MAEVLEKTETNIDIFHRARKKFDKCEFVDQMACRLFFCQFDTSMDILHHCGSCKTNTDEPTTTRHDVRVR